MKTTNEYKKNSTALDIVAASYFGIALINLLSKSTKVLISPKMATTQLEISMEISPKREQF